MRLKTKIEKIIEAIKDTNIREIEITSFWGARKIKLKKSTDSNNIIYETENKKVIKQDDISLEKQDDDKIIKDIIETGNNENIEVYTIIKAPLVGTYYSSAKPGEPPFIDKGRSIKVGDAVCIIEAMKIFNTIESEFNGEVMEIFVQDGDPVEFGQELFAIKEPDV